MSTSGKKVASLFTHPSFLFLSCSFGFQFWWKEKAGGRKKTVVTKSGKFDG
jgi:hypothetical protein